MELAFTHAASNRVHILPVTGGPPAAFFVDLSERIGPSGVVLAPIAGFGTAGVEHPIITTSLNGTEGHALTFYRNDGGPTAFTRSEDRPNFPTIVANVFTPADGGPSTLLYVEHPDPNSSSSVLHSVALDSGATFPDSILASNFSSTAEVVAAEFGGGPVALLHAPGSANLVSVAFGSTRRNFSFSAGHVAQLFILEETAGNALAAVRDDRSGVDIYDFDPVTGPTFRESIDLAGFPDEKVTAVLGGLDNFQLATGGMRTLRTTPFVLNGTDGYQIGGPANELPRFHNGGPGIFTNVVFFSEDPLVNDDTDRRFLRTEQSPDWASREFGASGGIRIESASFVNPATGLQNAGTNVITGVSNSPARSLINQEQDDISFAFFAPIAGTAISELQISPPPGSYRGSISATITATGSGTIHARVGESGPWIKAKNNVTVPGIDSTSTVHYFIALGDEKSPIASATYRFDIAPDELDADGDGLPDFVERSLGLDPLSSGGDKDGDGASDLAEAIAGTDPDDPSDTPGATDLAIDEEATVDIAATPRSISGAPGSLAIDSPSVVPPSGSPAVATRVRAHDVAGALLAEALAEGSGFPTADLDATPLGAPGDLIVLSTTPTFSIFPSGNTATAVPRGRETIALVPAPVIDPRSREIQPHTPGDAEDWIAKRRDYYENLATPTVTRDITPLTTLAALLLERVVSEIAGTARGLPSSGSGGTFSPVPNDSSTNDVIGFLGISVTFTPFRNGESTINVGEPFTSFNQSLRLSVDEYRDLLAPLHFDGFPQPVDGGYDLTAALAGIEADLTPGIDPETDALLDVAARIYSLSAERGELAPGAYDSPFETLRRFIRFPGPLPGDVLAGEGYATRIDGLELEAAAIAVGNIVARHTAPEEIVQLTIEVNTDPELFHNVPTATDVALYDGRLNPFEFETGTPPLPGTRFKVSAVLIDPGRYDFLPAGVDSYRVITVALDTLADFAAANLDSNGNLLDDSYERFFFPGSEGVNPFQDPDGDGYTTLQEFLDGTDPSVTASRPAGPVSDLSPPAIRINVPPGQSPQLTWDFPSAYADFFSAEIHQGSNLDDFLYLGQTVELAAEGTTVPDPAERQFYRLRMRLK